MMLKNLKLAALLLMLPMSAFATPIMTIDDSGQLMGASGIEVGGSLYDVSFVGGDSCNGMFGGCDAANFTFSDAQAADAASYALLTQVFLSDYDTSPAMTNGCSNRKSCFSITPFGTNGDSFYLAFARNNSGDLADTFSTNRALSVSFTIPASATWAIWSIADLNQQRVLAATEPGILILMGLGFVGFGLRRNKN